MFYSPGEKCPCGYGKVEINTELNKKSGERDNYIDIKIQDCPDGIDLRDEVTIRVMAAYVRQSYKGSLEIDSVSIVTYIDADTSAYGYTADMLNQR